MSDLRERVEVVFRDVFGDDQLDIREETTAADVDGWDSLMHINLIVALEKTFHVKFATAEIARLKGDGQTVGSLLRVLAGKLEQTPG